MKSLRTLLRVAKRQLETLRRLLGVELERQGAVEQSIRALQQSIVAEQQVAAASYEGSRAFAGFSLAANQRRAALTAEAQNIAAECDRLRTLIADAHVDRKSVV